ncbi:sigma-70 family RNA polymerase sigma factor [Chelatococcus reniformis]|uniref:sigma-70 family RNA polymerase sigma factor n=1 Tax=Chelatococcus reniformis TaxID=1494448 RepID=UPI0024540E03|nr:sigma-70 family RNA polymerase sigma factor [Chelatococcus reniformis]
MQAVEERLRALMIAALAGDEQAYRTLLTDLGGRLRAYYARRLGPEQAAVEDLVQETLIAVHTRRSTYDAARPFTAWLHAIARYKLIDHFRARSARPTVSTEDVAELLAADESAPTDARMDVERLLEGLPPQPRRFIRAVKLDGRSVAEVSAASGVSESAVKVAIHRGLKLLSRRLKGPNAP